MNKDAIITLPNPHLRQKSARVGIITPEIQQIVNNMVSATTSWDMSRNHEVGVALAAIQIDQPYRIVVIKNDLEDKHDHSFTTFINPEITKFEGALTKDYEGCLSVPDIYGKLSRYEKVRVKALNIEGKPFRVTVEGFLARVFQHEIDHTNGIVFVDHIKDNPNAFYRLSKEGKLEKLDYATIKDNPVFWQ